MKTTDKEPCRLIIDLLALHGIEDVVLSPGSRNTPLIIAANRHPDLRTHVIIDERVAAFVGLGISLQTQKPVALICTSGSAVLNYAPALSEAFYRHIPLIAISADRPAEWIDQDDSQTIRQVGVLSNIVKGSFDIIGDNSDRIQNRFAVRTVNDAIILAKKGPKGPVHINVRLDAPLGNVTEVNKKSKTKIELWQAQEKQLSDRQFETLARECIGKKIMVIGGFGAENPRLDRALDDFVKATGAILLHEAQSNLHPSISVGHIDAVITTFSDEDSAVLKPDIVISFGGAILSRMIKQFLRDAKNIDHWHLAESSRSIDCFMNLTRRIECERTNFFEKMSEHYAQAAQPNTAYLKAWLAKKSEARLKILDFFKECPWSDFYAIGRLLKIIPRKWNLQLSNGTSVRYAQLFDYSAIKSIECNRGVSGIDGATSTAVGAHIYYDDNTLLITGDMSAQYDIGALALKEITPRFKMAVLNNKGGGIFRYIKSTSKLDECEQCFSAMINLPLRQLAEAYGFAYFEATDKISLDKSFGLFAAEDRRPAILNIITPPDVNTETLNKFFNSQKSNFQHKDEAHLADN